MRLLVAEDDKILGSSLKEALETRGYGVDWVQDGEAALYAVQDLSYDMMILDINLPKTTGLGVLKKLRQDKNDISVLVLTAQDAPLQKVEGLDSGADDYMIKPFDLEELLARLRSLKRRREGRTESVLRAGAVELDPVGKVVKKDGLSIILTAKEFRVLLILMERSGKYVTKGDIEYALYNADDAKESNIVEVTIYSLRKKLGNEFIRTIRGVGYMVGA
ncbi:MAG: response regulator transcription factor [Proteobacteria bacterium]|nr:response regulator transcription factor [Pseudomonadota bacterium]